MGPLRLSKVNAMWFFIEHASGLVVDIDGAEESGKLILYEKSGSDNQLWKYDEDDKVLVSKTGLVADVLGANTDEGASVIGYSRNETENQKFKIKGLYIHSKMHDMVFDVQGGDISPRAEIIMYPKQENSNQQFFLVPEHY